MKDIASSLFTISDILNETIDVADHQGRIIFSSSAHRAGRLINNFDKANCIRLIDGRNMFVYIENADCKIVRLVQLLLDNMISGETSDFGQNQKLTFTIQELLISVINGRSVTEEECKKYNIPYGGSYIVFCISLLSDEYFNDAYTLMINSFNDDGCWTISLGGKIALVKRIESIDEDTYTFAKGIKSVINSELYIDALIGIGNIHSGIENIKKSFSESVESIDIGRLFSIPHNIYAFKDIQCERIISQIPPDRTPLVLNDILSKDIIKMLDGEIIKTAGTMFKNNLNISESAKELYIHRNTLIYRLDKIQRITGLDLRKFEDAAVFKLALLLNTIHKAI